jgi:hypothetical protein
MPINGVALGALGIGGIFIYSAIKGKSILATTQNVITGKSPTTAPQANPITNVVAPQTSNASINTANANVLTGGGTNAQNKALALSMAANMGWGDSANQSALVSLWNGESGFDTTATNPSSGAYGIPQSLPGSKMASAGADWKTNPATQIRWGLTDIKDTYGSPSAAYAKWLSRSPHWY